jgi:hypothetical protein
LAAWFDHFAYGAVSAPTHLGIPGDFYLFWQNAVCFVHSMDLSCDIIKKLPYPPPFLLLTTPFSWVPARVGYAAWLLLGGGFLAAAARRQGWSWSAILLGLAGPPVWFCGLLGQSSFWVSGLLLLALGRQQRNPRLAGVAAAALIIKPQFGLLLPAFFGANRNWRAITAATLGVIGLAALTTICFGAGIWQNLQANNVPSARGLLRAAWPAGFQSLMVTPFVMFRSLGADEMLAGAGQVVSSFLTMGAIVHFQGRNFPPLKLMALVGCLVPLATPYAFIYDLPFLCLTLAAWYIETADLKALAALSILYGFTCIYPVMSYLCFSTGALFLSVILLLLLASGRPQKNAYTLA